MSEEHPWQLEDLMHCKSDLLAENASLKEQLFSANSSLQILCGAAGVGDPGEICGAIDRLKSELAALRDPWLCPICGHVMTETESKGYKGCPDCFHFAQHMRPVDLIAELTACQQKLDATERTIKELEANLEPFEKELDELQNMLCTVRTERDDAERAQAQMRNILLKASWHEWCEYNGAAHYELLNVSQFEMEQALSTTPTTRYVRAEELERVQKFLEDVYNWCVSDCPSDIDGDAALEMLQLVKSLRGEK